MEDNVSRQFEEIEALSSIYGNDLKLINALDKTYSIAITGENTSHAVNLSVTFTGDYPSDGPPTYLLSAPWLKREDRISLVNSLEEIYLENIGEVIVYLWIEKIREFLSENKSLDSCDATNNNLLETFDHKSTCIQETVTAQNPSHISLHLPVPEIIHGESFTERKSTFQAHLAHISDFSQVDMVVKELHKNKKIANATHNIYAYRLKNEKEILQQGCNDDGETHAGSRMLHLLQIIDVYQVMVVVSRWYGGVLLGPDRFKCINNATRNILEENGFISEKEKNKKSVKIKQKKTR